MAGYTARKAPNVSQYVASLNTIPSAHDGSSQQDESFDLDNELARFTNADFMEYGSNGLLESSMQEYGLDQDKSAKRDGSPHSNNNTNIHTKSLDFSTST